jgi:hypothetical protein
MDDLQRRAAEESGLAAEYRDDPALLEFYARRLLRKGWAGQRTPAEARYIGLVHKAEGKYIGQRESLERRRQNQAGGPEK